MTRRFKLLGSAVLGLATMVATYSHAAVVGDIEGYYSSPSQPLLGFACGDCSAMAFFDTSGSPITNATITVAGGTSFTDTFNIGTIAAGGSFLLVNGVTSDGGSGHTYFALNGQLDNSDVSINGFPTSSSSLQFDFEGTLNGQTVSSSLFTPATSVKQSVDGTQTINFVGGPNGDPCNDCYGPGVVAQISTPVSSAPEPTTWALTILAVGLAGAGLRQARRNGAAVELAH